MAEVGTKKSMNVVSKKNKEVCSVRSNNSLIDLDNISTSNNQLNSLCDDEEDDDELILSNNSKNELTVEDKSLQELIENELALRICSGQITEDEDDEEEEEEDSIKVQPEIKKIVLEPRQDPLDVNAEFIVAEIEHYSIIEEPYGYQNGHITESSPKNQINSSISQEILEENFEQETADFQNEEVVLESESDVSLDRSSKEVTEKEVFPGDESEEILLNSSDDPLIDIVDHVENSKPTFDQYLNEQDIQQKSSLEDLENVQEDNFSDIPEADRKFVELSNAWLDLKSGNSTQNHQMSKFSDDFDHIPNQSQSINDSLSSTQEVDSSSQSVKESDISLEKLHSSLLEVESSKSSGKLNSSMLEVESSKSSGNLNSSMLEVESSKSFDSFSIDDSDFETNSRDYNSSRDFDTSRDFDSSRDSSRNMDSMKYFDSSKINVHEPISSKEASGVDEKDCSPNRDTCEGFPEKKAEVIRNGKIVDNDEFLPDSMKTDLNNSVNTSGDVENTESRVCESKKVVNDKSQFGAINCTKLKPAQDDFDSWTTVEDAIVGKNEMESKIVEKNEVDINGMGLVENCGDKKVITRDLEQKEDVKESNVAPLATVDVESTEDSSSEDDVSLLLLLMFLFCFL